MLITAETLKGYSLESQDGEIGKVEDFYLDPQCWEIRYMVVNLGNWLIGRQILISTSTMLAVRNDGKHIAVNLTKKQIEHSLELEVRKPIFQTLDFSDLYEMPALWNAPNIWGFYDDLTSTIGTWNQPWLKSRFWDPYLRNTFDVSGSFIHLGERNLGRIEDIIMDDQTWTVRYLIVNGKSYGSNKQVVVPTQAIERIVWHD